MNNSKVLGVVFIVLSIVQFVWFIETWRHESFLVGIGANLSSPWSIVNFLDYFMGTVFITVYLWARDGPPLLGIPGRFFAIINLFVGSFVVFGYTGYLLVTSDTIAKALLPEPSSAQPERPNSVKAVFMLLLGLFVASCVWAIAVQSLGEGGAQIMSHPWSSRTLFDNMTGLFFSAVLIIRREATALAQCSWLLALIVFGNGATALYAILVARNASERDMGFAPLLLSPKDSIF